MYINFTITPRDIIIIIAVLLVLALLRRLAR